MNKFGTFSDYPRPSLVTAQAALLTAWRSLERYHDDLDWSADWQCII